MRITKSLGQLLLGSAAVLTVAAGAQAADLPSRKAAPVQYVKICDAYGSGFFYIPGTDTCLKVGGYVRAEYQFTPGQKINSIKDGSITQVAADQDTTGMEMRGRVDMDARTQTQWGTVRTVIKIRGTNTDGIRSTKAPATFQTAYAPAGNVATAIKAERMYIQFAGFTAGLTDEYFNEVPGNPFVWTGGNPAGFTNGVKSLMYTAIFPGGWSWTNSIESRGDFGNDQGALNIADPVLKSGPGQAPTTAATTYTNAFDTGYNLVSNIKLEQSWGLVGLSGAIGNNSTPPLGFMGTANVPLSGGTKYGSWAIGPEVNIKLPWIAPGDEIWANASYGTGLLGEVLSMSFNNLSGDPSNKRVLGGILRQDSNLMVTSADAAGDPLSYASVKGYQAYIMYTHYWSPQWHSTASIGDEGVIEPAIAPSAGVQLGNANMWNAQADLIWNPTKGLDIGLDVMYGYLVQQMPANAPAAFRAACAAIGKTGCGLDEGNWLTKLRIARVF